jgi:ankyrin repeat protein
MSVGAELTLQDDDPLALEVTAALQAGDVRALERLLAEYPEPARARVEKKGESCGSRTLLHVFADWPGKRPNARAVVALLQQAGADLDAPFIGAHSETPLHWAASNDDVALIDALLDAGAQVDASGSVIGGGTPLADATAFGQWRAAERLVQRGARTNLFQSATLGLTDRVESTLRQAPPDRDELNAAFWGACHGGRRNTAELLMRQGADPNWIGWDDLTALGAAERSGAAELVAWLRDQSARSASEPVRCQTSSHRDSA